MNMQVPPFKKTLMEAMPYIDFLFGNETEARAFAESEGWTTTEVAEIALKVGGCPLQTAHGQPLPDWAGRQCLNPLQVPDK